MFLSRPLVACVVTLVCAACSPPPVTTDAATEAAADVAPVDAPPDVPPPPPMLTGPCLSDTDCPEGNTCLLNTNGWPGGYCTVSCGRDIDCDTHLPYIAAVCRAPPGTTARTCLRQCLNGFDCARPGYTCVKPTDTATSGVCLPSCTATSCGDGARCNEWTGRCMATTATYPPAGVDDGEPCTMSGTASECRSRQCIAQVNTAGTQSGWNAGYCISDCALTAGWNSTDLFTGDTFPQANCPSGAICFPSTNDTAEQGPGQCLHECTADTDCRAAAGYICRRTFNLVRFRPYPMTVLVPHTWNNGFCQPMDCLNDTSHHCPTGYTCDSRSDGNGGMTGRCIPM